MRYDLGYKIRQKTQNKISHFLFCFIWTVIKDRPRFITVEHKFYLQAKATAWSKPQINQSYKSSIAREPVFRDVSLAHDQINMNIHAF